MSTAPTVILSSGGMRSFAAAAIAATAQDKPRLILLHVLDARDNARVRSQHVHQQAEYFKIKTVIETELPKPKAKLQDTSQEPHATPLLHAQVLIQGLAQATDLGANRLLWPAQVNADFDKTSRVFEQTVLAQQLAKIDHPFAATLETPLLELSDQQLVELGGQMGLPWQMAWSCMTRGDKPCRVCTGCRRREAAFEAAGMTDPASSPVPIHS